MSDIVINDPGRDPEDRRLDEVRAREAREAAEQGQKDSSPVTADELHRHIQAVIFGRPDRDAERAERFDQLQERLHNIVDTFYGMKKEAEEA